MVENITGLKVGHGPAFERWLKAIARGVVEKARQAKALDEARDEG